MKMPDVVLKGFGYWLLAIIESIIVFFSFYLGKFTNGIDPAFSLFIGEILIATQILLILIIKYYFKLSDEEQKVYDECKDNDFEKKKED